MAGLHSGIWGERYSCAKCAENAKMKRAWGCEKRCEMVVPTFTEVIDRVEYRYWNCPVRFITPSITKFMTIYKYYKDFPGAPMPPMDEVNDLFLFAYRYYEAQYDKCARQVVKESARG